MTARTLVGRFFDSDRNRGTDTAFCDRKTGDGHRLLAFLSSKIEQKPGTDTAML